MRNIKLFSKITYLVTNRFAYKDKNVVKVFYIYKNIYNIVLPLDIKKVKAHGYSDEAYYINEAKKIIDKMINNGSLDKYSEKYLKDKKKKSILLLAIPSICVCLALGISLGTYFALRSKAQEVNVEVPEINGLMFSNEKAYVGQDYDTNISVNTTLTTSLLPDTLNKVTSGNRTVQPTEYTYTVNDNKESGSLHIPGQYIEGDVKIELELVTPGPEYVNFDFTSESCNIKDKEGKDVTQVIKGETFEGKISLNQETAGIHLPSVLDITMGGVPVPLSDYEFNPYTGEFSIVATGDIKINVEQDDSDVMLIYQYAKNKNKLTFYITDPTPSCEIDWGDTVIEPVSKSGACSHQYSEVADGTRYIIKISGLDSSVYDNFMLGNNSAEQLISIAYFDNAQSGIDIGAGEAKLLEEFYMGKNSYTSRTLVAPNLHTLVVDENNVNRNKSFNSNIIVHYNIDGEGNLVQGCSRSIIPDDENIVSINDQAFDSSKIKEINIPATVNTIFNNPFKNAGDLTKITVNPNSEYFTSRDHSGKEYNMIAAKQSGEKFESNELITACNTTVIPDDGTVKTIKEGAYCGLSSIKNIDIPDCVEKISGAAIHNCPSLENINFQNSSNLTKFFYGDVEYIGLGQNKGQLSGCSSLKSVTIPTSVTHVSYLDGDDWDNFPLFDETDTALTEMIVLCPTPPTLGGKLLFDSSRTPPKLTSIYVPNDSVGAYKSATRWSTYASLIKPISDRPTH